MRNAIGVTLPLVIGAATGSVAAGLITSSGALNVAFRDNQSPYPERWRHLLSASVIAGLAVFLGSLSGNDHVLAVLVTMAWALAAGMLVALGQALGDLGTMSLVMLCVYSAVPLPPHEAALSGLAAFAGELSQPAWRCGVVAAASLRAGEAGTGRSVFRTGANGEVASGSGYGGAAGDGAEQSGAECARFVSTQRIGRKRALPIHA